MRRLELLDLAVKLLRLRFQTPNAAILVADLTALGLELCLQLRYAATLAGCNLLQAAPCGQYHLAFGHGRWPTLDRSRAHIIIIIIIIFIIRRLFDTRLNERA